MKVLIVLTYYRPHVSGLTTYAERLAQGLARRGHEVTVLTSRFDRSTPRVERMNGVRVVRAPVLFRVNKGVIMPTFGILATRLVRTHEVVSLHLPQFDAPGVALRGRLFRKPTVLTYQCDLALPPGRVNRIVNRVVDAANAVAARFAHRIVASSADYAEHSPYLRRRAGKVEIIPPPIDVPPVDAAAVEAFRQRHGVRSDAPVIGMAARLATEKGAEVLAAAMPAILARHPGVRVVFVGEYENVFGEAEYGRRIHERIRDLGDRWKFLGVLPDQEMAAFYSCLDAIVVPSLNSTEAFGMVQVEAMLCGTPAVASDLPGVRQPILQTGMGEIFPVGDSPALAAAVLRVLDDRASHARPRAEIAARFSTARTLDGYEALFERLREDRR